MPISQLSQLVGEVDERGALPGVRPADADDRDLRKSAGIPFDHRVHECRRANAHTRDIGC